MSLSRVSLEQLAASMLWRPRRPVPWDGINFGNRYETVMGTVNALIRPPPPERLREFFGNPVGRDLRPEYDMDLEPGSPPSLPPLVLDTTPKVLNGFGKYSFLEVALECKDVWHYMLAFVDWRSKVKTARVSRAWREAARGVDLEHVVGDRAMIKSIWKQDVFLLRAAKILWPGSMHYCPASVTDLYIGVEFEIDLSLFRNITNLRSLTLGPYSGKVLELPSSLTCLNARHSILRGLDLPPGLTELDTNDICAVKELPILLRKLRCGINWLNVFSGFPSGLVELTIRVDRWCVCREDFFPKNLEILRIASNDAETAMGCEVYRGMKCLKEIVLAGGERFCQVSTKLKVPSHTVIMNNKYYNSHSGTLAPFKVYKHGVEGANYPKGWLAEGLIELHNTGGGTLENLKTTIGHLPSSLLVIFHRDVPYDPVSFKPIPWTDSGITGLSVTVEPLYTSNHF